MATESYASENGEKADNSVSFFIYITNISGWNSFSNLAMFMFHSKTP